MVRHDSASDNRRGYATPTRAPTAGCGKRNRRAIRHVGLVHCVGTSDLLKPHRRLAISLIPLNYIRKNNIVLKRTAPAQQQNARSAGIRVGAERVYDL